MISYTITALYPILKVKEAASGTGGLCGSTFLNRRFGEFLTNKLENVEGWDDELLAEAMERFDSVVSDLAILINPGSSNFLSRSRSNTLHPPTPMATQSPSPVSRTAPNSVSAVAVSLSKPLR